jgi:hypothetical protein
LSATVCADFAGVLTRAAALLATDLKELRA